MPAFAALDRLKADLDILRPLDPEQEARVLQKFRLDWNYHSNAIEGNALTLGETRSLLLHGLTAQGKSLRDHLDIRGHNDAVLWLEEIVRDDRPLTENFVREMHHVLLGEPYDSPALTPDGLPTRKRIVPGRYKTLPNNVVTATGETFRFASPEETPARMTALVDGYRAELATPTQHPVALAARFHYDFVRIHPFDDGNGRMSRLLMNLILLRHGYPMTVIKQDDRNRYLAALAQADAGEFAPFLNFITENIEASLLLMLRAARGESIEEPSDLDKKLALLKVQVLNRETVAAKVWNLETQTKLYDALLKFWFADLASQVERFNPFFVNKGVVFAFYSVSYSGENSIRTLAEAQKLAEKSLAFSAQPFDSLLFNFAWNSFKQPGYDFNARLVLEFIFHESFFEAKSTVHDGGISEEDLVWGSYYKSPYESAYDIIQIQALNHQLANKVFDFIAAKMQEPPAA